MNEDEEEDGFYRYSSKIYEKSMKKAFSKKQIEMGNIVTLKSNDGKVLKVACGIKTPDAQWLDAESDFMKALLGLSEGDIAKYEGGFEVLKIE